MIFKDIEFNTGSGPFPVEESVVEHSKEAVGLDVSPQTMPGFAVIQTEEIIEPAIVESKNPNDFYQPGKDDKYSASTIISIIVIVVLGIIFCYHFHLN